MEKGTSIILSAVGAMLLIGLVTNFLSDRLRIPRVTLLIVCGALIGPSFLDLLPAGHEYWYEIISNIALLMVGFLLGCKLSLANLREFGRPVFLMSGFKVLGVAALVFAGMMAMGMSLPVALLMAGIGPASAPAAVQNVAEESRAKGRFTDMMLGIVAIDDAWGLMIFSIMLAAAQALTGHGSGMDALLNGGWEIAGALLVGSVLGVIAGRLTDHLSGGEPLQAETLGFIFLVGGVAQLLGVSFLLAAMAMGVAVTNTAEHTERAFNTVRDLEWPIMILFFVLAGSSLHIHQLMQVGFLGIAYVLLRIAGLVIGAWAGGGLAKAGPKIRRWMGIAIMPQAGVALGMALVASNKLPAAKDVVLPLIIGTTVVFELMGPIFTRFALERNGDAGRAESEGEPQQG